ncbi:MAG: hypothetical protein WCJ61_08520, partial [Paludibacter sp.]
VPFRIKEYWFCRINITFRNKVSVFCQFKSPFSLRYICFCFLGKFIRSIHLVVFLFPSQQKHVDEAKRAPKMQLAFRGSYFKLLSSLLR